MQSRAFSEIKKVQTLKASLQIDNSSTQLLDDDLLASHSVVHFLYLTIRDVWGLRGLPSVTRPHHYQFIFDRVSHIIGVLFLIILPRSILVVYLPLLLLVYHLLIGLVDIGRAL